MSKPLESVPPDIPAADVRLQLQRICASSYFQGSARRRNLLSYLVEETLAGRCQKLKGYSIALAVFDRDDSFDPSVDPLVRLEAGRLRHSLDTYYANATAQDTVRITVPKGAYIAYFTRFEHAGTVPAVDAPVPEDDPLPPQEVTPEPSPTGPAKSIRLLAVAGIAVAGMAVAGLSWVWLGRAAPVPEVVHGPAIIVLPFEKLDASANTQLIAATMTHDLISDLMRFPDLRLYTAQASAKQGAATDPRQLGRELGVSYVVNGTVQSDAGMLRLSAQLSDATTGQVLWSGKFDRMLTPDDLLGMQSELSSSVATALAEPYGVVNAVTAQRLSVHGAESMPSYACVLNAYEYRRSFDDTLFAPALACLKTVVINEPDYAEAWAMLGWMHLDAARQDMIPAADVPASIDAAYAAAAHAVVLDPRNERGLEALSAIDFSKGNFAEAEQLQRSLVALNPHNPEILAQLGWRLAVRGHLDEGIPFLEEAIARTANPPGWYFHLISVHNYLKGDYAASLAALETSLKTGSSVGFALAAINHAKLGDMDAAQTHLSKMADAWPLLASDPVAAFSKFQTDDDIVAALVDGLRAAGLNVPDPKTE